MSKVSILFTAILITVGNRMPLHADELLPRKANAKAQVAVQCYGRLRHGMVAIGAETTGTTVSFQRVTWELSLPDEPTRALAEELHKQPVVVTGTMRRVEGTESGVRWIVDVSKLAEVRSREMFEESATVKIQGTLRAALAKSGDTPNFSVQSGDQIWRLSFADRDLQNAASALISRPVLLTGTVLSPPEETERASGESNKHEAPIVRVRAIELSSDDANDSRFFMP